MKPYPLILAATLSGLVLNLGATVYLTHSLSVDEFGGYRLAVTLLLCGATALQLGVPYAASVQLARSTSSVVHGRLVSAAMTLLLGFSTLAAVVLLAVWGVLPSSLSDLPLFTAVLVVPVTLHIAAIEMFRGSDSRKLAVQTALPYAVFLAVVVVAGTARREWLSLQLVLVAYGVSFATTILVTAWSYLTRFDPNEEFRRIGTGVRSYGGSIFLGSLAAVSGANLLSLIVGTRLGTAEFAKYALALSLSSPLQLVPGVMGVALFREYAQQSRISARQLTTTLALTVTATTASVLVILFGLPAFFPDSYETSFHLAAVMAIGYSVVGLGDFLNRFLGAHERGRAVMVAAIASGLTSIVVTLTLLPSAGLWAPVVGLMASSSIYLILLAWSYTRLQAHLGERSRR